MINTSELQMGNYIRHLRTGELIQVTGIGYNVVLYNKDGKELAESINNLAPVSIAEDKAVLLKLLQADERRLNFEVDITGEHLPRVVFEPLKRGLEVTNIGTLHQVQNLYRLLYGEDLPIDL